MTGTGSQATKAKNSAYNLNVNNSTAKTAIDNWYSTNLSSYNTYLEDTVFCNDRSYKTEGSSNTYTQSGWNLNGGDLTKTLYFGTFNRFNNNWYSSSNVPSVACPNETDRFTVSNTNGNGALTYPVGLLTADEIILAGVGGNNGSATTTYYLYTNDYYWSLSPGIFYVSYDVEFYVSSDGTLNSNLVSNSSGLRPAVSLKPGTQVASGTGTVLDPYVIE